MLTERGAVGRSVEPEDGEEVERERISLPQSSSPLMAVQQQANSGPGRGRGRVARFNPVRAATPGAAGEGNNRSRVHPVARRRDGAPYVKRLHAIAFGDNVRAALSAIAVLLERGYGKVPQDPVPMPMLTFQG